MKATMTIIPVDGDIEVRDLDRVPSLEEMQKVVGGYLEVVPHLSRYRGEKCVAFCNEEGKLEGLPVNFRASALWDTEIERHFKQPNRDLLVGNVLILTGDAEFFREL